MAIPTEPHSEYLLSTDTVEKLRKECAAKIRPNAIMSKNRRSMPSQCSYGGLWLLAPQLPRPPKSLFDPQACGSTNYGSSLKTEFFNGIDPKQKPGSEFSMAGVDPKRTLRLIGAVTEIDCETPPPPSVA
ncbi:MAG: hypothetical protein WA231_08950 [Methylocella sp.]